MVVSDGTDFEASRLRKDLPPEPAEGAVLGGHDRGGANADECVTFATHAALYYVGGRSRLVKARYGPEASNDAALAQRRMVRR